MKTFREWADGRLDEILNWSDLKQLWGDTKSGVKDYFSPREEGKSQHGQLWHRKWDRAKPESKSGLVGEFEQNYRAWKSEEVRLANEKVKAWKRDNPRLPD